MGSFVRVCSSPLRFLFEVALLSRKCVLIGLGAAVTDPLLASLLALASSLPLWLLTVTWKPFAKQMQVRILQTIVISLQVCVQFSLDRYCTHCCSCSLSSAL